MASVGAAEKAAVAFAVPFGGAIVTVDFAAVLDAAAADAGGAPLPATLAGTVIVFTESDTNDVNMNEKPTN